eukprot:1054744-Pleurochrysis_carterae.AAC.1
MPPALPHPPFQPAPPTYSPPHHPTTPSHLSLQQPGGKDRGRDGAGRGRGRDNFAGQPFQ